MSSKINELLRQLAKTKKVHKHKFVEGKPIKIPSLLGTTKPKSIKPRHTTIPLSGYRVHWHIAIDLIKAPTHKKTQYKSYIPRGIPSNKISKDQLRIWRNFGQGIFVGHLRPFVDRDKREYLWGYAQHVVSNRKIYTKEHRIEAKTYLRVHSIKGAPKLTKQYFFIKYGTEKFHRLGDDPYYQTLLKIRKQASSKTDLKKIDAMLNARRREFRHTKADYYYTQYIKEYLEHKIETNRRYGENPRSHQFVYDLEAKLERMLKPSNKPYFSYLEKYVPQALSQTAWGTDEEFIKVYYAKYNGWDPAWSIGRGREKYAYEKLINWLVETGLELPLHSTNLTWLKNPRLINTMRIELVKKGFKQEQIDAYIAANLTNPENLSRTGQPDPKVDVHSLYGYFRETPQGAYFGQDAERAITRNLHKIETNFHEEFNKFAATDRAKRRNLEKDIRSFMGTTDLTDHFNIVPQYKKELKKNREKVVKQRKK